MPELKPNNPRPKKSLGQNYLIDENISKNIVNTFLINEEDQILEIGPGKGSLTKHLLMKSRIVKVIEIDSVNCGILNYNFPDLQIINKDFLKINLKDLKDGDNKLRIIGNIPYNITTPIIFKLADNRNIINDAQLMIQEEVAQRITAKPNSKEYGIPTVILNVICRPKLLFKVSRNCFYPKPKVDSRIIYLDFNISKENEINDFSFFRKLVKTAFNTRRKTLRNSLKNLNVDLSKCGIDLSLRAENLSIDKFIELSNNLSI
ncbi:MAG: ribosomal RNA small subunit methyltransferase A [Ignavibacteria bacterium]|nr:ribosomal RNA small subunit methyltransferase A [Ignavibacteria bacterium]